MVCIPVMSSKQLREAQRAMDKAVKSSPPLSDTTVSKTHAPAPTLLQPSRQGKEHPELTPVSARKLAQNGKTERARDKGCYALIQFAVDDGGERAWHELTNFFKMCWKMKNLREGVLIYFLRVLRESLFELPYSVSWASGCIAEIQANKDRRRNADTMQIAAASIREEPSRSELREAAAFADTMRRQTEQKFLSDRKHEDEQRCKKDVRQVPEPEPNDDWDDADDILPEETLQNVRFMQKGPELTSAERKKRVDALRAAQLSGK